jgi:hypothetical protein
VATRVLARLEAERAASDLAAGKPGRIDGSAAHQEAQVRPHGTRTGSRPNPEAVCQLDCATTLVAPLGRWGVGTLPRTAPRRPYPGDDLTQQLALAPA